MFQVRRRATQVETGETILKVDETSVTDPERLREVLAGKKADDIVNSRSCLLRKRSR